MPQPNAQDRRLRALMSDHAAVAAQPLPDGTLSLIARNAAGEVELVELVDRGGRPLRQEEALRSLAHARQSAARLVEQADEAVTALVALDQARGGEPNLSTIATDVGIARSTLYKRLESVVVRPAR